MRKKAFILFFCGLLLAAYPARAENTMSWRPSLDDSSMSFSSPSGDIPVMAFQPDVGFDSSSPQNSHLNFSANFRAGFLGQYVTPDMKAMMKQAPHLGMGASDTAAPGAATYASSEIVQQGGNQFLANGTLTINGTARPLPISFTAEVTNGKLVLQGTFSINASHYEGPKLPATGSGQIDGSFTFVETPR